MTSKQKREKKVFELERGESAHPSPFLSIYSLLHFLISCKQNERRKRRSTGDEVDDDDGDDDD
jgi:hypothetical protein